MFSYQLKKYLQRLSECCYSLDDGSDQHTDVRGSTPGEGRIAFPLQPGQ
jgi:hypothetical protein